MNPLKPKPISSLVGLALYGRQLTAIVGRQNGEGVTTEDAVSTRLSLDPLTNDPELVAQEIRTFLDQSEIRETHCLLCLPPNLALVSAIELPELSDEDRESYLELQAESEFPFGVEDLNIASLDFESPSHTKQATLVAFPKNHIQKLETVLTQARLRPQSLTLGTPAKPECASPTLILDVHSDHVALCVQCGSGFAAMRCLDEVFETDKDGSALDVDLLLREIKITLGQLAPSVRQHLKTAILWSSASAPAWDKAAIETRLADMGLRATAQSGTHEALTQSTAHYLKEQRSKLEFLPPKETRLQALAKKVSSRGNAWIGGTAAAIVVLTAAVFYYQGYRLGSLEREWNGMAAKVTELEDLQNKIRQFRPWFDQTVPSLQIVRQLAEAFPKEGSIWVKSFEIKGNSRVYCSGSARTNQELIAVMAELREMENIDNLTLQQVRGEAPVQFAFNFQWKPGGAR